MALKTWLVGGGGITSSASGVVGWQRYCINLPPVHQIQNVELGAVYTKQCNARKEEFVQSLSDKRRGYLEQCSLISLP